MIRRIMPLLVGVAFLGTPPSHSSHSSHSDITGVWKIDYGHAPNGRAYWGQVTITRKGECYDIEWALNSGEKYHGVGMVLRETILAVAWSNTPRESGYGVVFYADNDEGGFEGWWCQPDGTQGVENLEGPATLAGTHQLAEGGNSGTGTVTMGRFKNSKLNYEMSWVTSLGSYDGFGTKLQEDAEIIAGVWGISSGGGTALYSLNKLDQGKMLGWWAAIGDTRQGEESLKR